MVYPAGVCENRTEGWGAGSLSLSLSSFEAEGAIMLVNGWTVEVVEGQLCCMACGRAEDMDAARDCLCDPCREDMGSEFQTDGVAYAVWYCVDSLLRAVTSDLLLDEAEVLLPSDSPVSAADVVRMARVVVWAETMAIVNRYGLLQGPMGQSS